MYTDQLPTILVNPNFTLIFTTLLATVVAFLPRLIIALLVFFVGKLISNYVGNAIRKGLNAVNLQRIVASFQLGIDMSADVEKSIKNVLVVTFRYVVLYITLIITLQILGLTEVAAFFASLVNFVPKLLSAFVILFIGVIIAGFVEALVKRALSSFDRATARLGGKIASYTVVSFFALMSLAELGVASTFINALFIGLVGALALAFGLAIGLGSKDLVSQVLLGWYSKRKTTKSK